MIIRCIKCQTPFEAGDNIRTRICKNKHKKYYVRDRSNEEFWYVRGAMKRYWQNPIYQMYYLLNPEHVQPSNNARARFNDCELDNIGD